jgi:signal peptidase I
MSKRGIVTLRRVCDALLIALILVVLFGVVLGRLVPMTGRTTLIIGGGSMEPAVPLGAAVMVDPVASTDLAVGDVVSLRTGTNLKSIFTHRVMRIVERDGGIWVETKGDANPSVDPSLTPAANLIGRVSSSIPYAGYLLALLSIPSGVLFVILLAGLLLTVTWLLETYEIELVGRTPIPAAVKPAALPDGGSTGSTIPSERSRRAHRLRRARHAAFPGD